MACADVLGVTDLHSIGGSDGGGGDATVMGSAEAGPNSGDGATPGNDGASGPDAMSATTDSGSPAVTEAGETGLTVSPTGVHLVRGGTALLTIVASSPIAGSGLQVSLANLPSGVSSTTPPTLTTAAPQATITLSAGASASLGLTTISIGAGGSSVPVTLVVADPSGTIDTTFGSGGIQVLTPAGTTSATAASVMLLDDGSIVIGGCVVSGSSTAWALEKMSPTGTKDATFETNVAAQLPSSGCIHALATDGKTIYAAGDANNEANVQAFNSDGTVYYGFQGSGSWQLDGTGNSGGTYANGVALARTGVPGVHDVYVAVNPHTPGGYPPTSEIHHVPSQGQENWVTLAASTKLYGVGVDPGGSVVVGGELGPSLFYAVRVSSALAPDPTFGGDGGALGVASADLFAQAAATDPEGGIWVGGSGTSTGQQPMLGHVNAAGLADIGDAGWVAVPPNVPMNSGILGMAVQSDGRVWSVGYGSFRSGTISPSWILRTTPGGTVDPSWGEGGVLQTDLMSGSGYTAIAVAPPPDGRVVVLSLSVGFSVTRYWP